MTRFDDLVVNSRRARMMGREMPVAIGRGGIGIKAGEGDGITPIGIWRVEEWRARRDRLALPFAHLKAQDRWVDAPDHALYNQEIHAPMPFSHERLHRADPLYDLIGIVDYNRKPIRAGRGSAIFIHQWRAPRFPTEGCVALARRDLIWIATHWRPHSRLIIQA